MRGSGGLWSCLAVALFAVACSAPSTEAPSDADLAEARAAAQELGATLMGELTTAIAGGGTVSAIGVCRDVAQAVALEVSARQGLEVGRTSLRVRNPANAPDGWERAGLEAFGAAAESGADLATLEHAEVVTENGVRTLRWMKVIPMGELCTQCHGSAIAPEVAAAIEAAYPEDRATGFEPGEVRGAFTVRKPL